jgi:alkyl sulfatase BDS1-like metallo-beta-lactamase superfamily hydrolase
MGGRDRAFSLARKAAIQRDDRWASELLNRLIMADSKDQDARNLLADVYTRMALEQENAVWRAHYLVAADELRNGIGQAMAGRSGGLQLMQSIDTADLFEMLAVRLDPAKVGDATAEIDFVIPERSERVRVAVRNQVLTYDTEPRGSAGDATVTSSRMQLAALAFQQALPDGVDVQGSRETVNAFAHWFTHPGSDFPILWRPDKAVGDASSAEFKTIRHEAVEHPASTAGLH